MRQYIQSKNPFQLDASIEISTLAGTDIIWRGKSDSGVISIQAFANQMFISPDGTKGACLPYATSTAGVFFCGDLTGFDWTTKTADSTVQYIAVSNTYFAVAHSAGLSVYDWTGTSVFERDSGTTPVMSQCYCVAFSPDGTKLAVIDQNAYLHQYDTSTWAYTSNTTATTSAWTRMAYNADGTKLVVQSYNSPYLFYLDTTTLSRTTISTNSAYRCYQVYGYPYYGWIMANPLDANVMYVFSSTSGSAPILSRWTLSGTPTMTHSILSGNAPNSKYNMHFDVRKNRIILTAGAGLIGTDGKTHYTYSIRPSDLSDIVLIELPEPTQYGVAVADSGIGNISGTVRDVDNDPAERRIRVYSRSEGKLIGEVMSDPISGDYEVPLPGPDLVDVQFMALDVESLNDLFFARVTPTEIP